MPNRCEFLTKLRGKFVTFAADQRGFVLPFATAVIVLLFGFATLATDFSRYFDLQTQLQKAADAFALAGAAELDGRADAEDRANAAIANLLAGNTANSSIFGTGAVAANATFYSALPATDNQPMANGTVAATQGEARFVDVQVTPVNINAFFPATIFGAANNAMTAGADAVAGFSQAICKQTPIWVCSGPTGGANDMLNPKKMKGREVSLVAPPGSALAPGNYGFLDIGCGPSASCLNLALGGNNNQTCVTLTTVSTTPGQKTSAGRYFDTRFDLYRLDASGARSSSVFTPDVNVRKGYDNAPLAPPPPTCNGQAFDTNIPPGSLPLPNDSNIAPPYTNPTIGNGVWQGGFAQYWATNFPLVLPVPLPPATRYAQYQNELFPYPPPTPPPAPSCGAGTLCSTPSLGGEVGAPICNPANAQPDRRIIYAAVLDCSKLGGGIQNVTPLGVVKFFLLQPLQPGGGFGTMLGEYLDLAKPGGADGVLHDIVQLYR